ncbi:MAG: sensor histidine kinase [Bacteroidetes bacterium]|nr:sensor histidine kinase [Bacteroidota bacterium]
MIIIHSTLLQNSNELKKYIELIFNVYNPVYLSAFILVVLILLLYISYRYIYNPLLRKHRKEKENLELQTAKLLVLFSELDPNPIMRINTSGEIVGLNRAAKEKFNNIKINVDKLDFILKKMDFDIKQSILDNQSFVITQKLNGNFYEINFHGISFLEMAQLYFLDVSVKKEYGEQMNLYQKLLSNSSAHLHKVLEEERSKFSRLLHDSVGQNLLLIKMNILNQKKMNREALNESEFEKALELLESTITEVKEISRNIRPLNIEELGLNTVLKSMCMKVSKEYGIETNVQIPDSDIILNNDLEVCIYMVVQEALNNIMRHSKAKKVTVNLDIKDETTTLIISDDGIGFKPTQLLNEKYISDGLGILNMQEQVERLNGSFHIDSSNNHGTIIIADFSLDNKRNGTKFDYKSTGS